MMIHQLFARILCLAGALALSISLVLAGPPSGGPPGLQRAIEIQGRHFDNLMSRNGVIGTAVGLDTAGAAIVKIFTANPSVPGLPAFLEGLPVQVEVTGTFTARADPKARFARPVPIGVSIGHTNVAAGTLGSQVYKSVGTGHGSVLYRYILSNNHILADSNNAAFNDWIVQPGPLDGGIFPGDQVGQLIPYKQLVWCTVDTGPDGGCISGSTADNRIDAALATTWPQWSDTSTPADGYGTPRQSPVGEAVGINVMKYGRSTGQTTGQIVAINAIIDVQYTVGRWARFGGQMIITPGTFSNPGDSGSLIVVADGADERRPVGLLFSGSDTHTGANPIDEVLAHYGVRISGDL